MKNAALIVCLCLGITVPALSSTTVQFIDTYGQTADIAGTWYNGQVSAGIYHIRVDGVLRDSFCIDLLDEVATSPEPYSIVSVGDAPNPSLGPMGAQKAAAISKLWAMAYSPTMTQNQAAALQLAIWDCVVDLDYNITAGGFHVIGNNYGAQTLLNNVQTYSGGADLFAVTSCQYQDFVTGVPVPGALALGSLGLTIVGWFRSRRRV